MPTLARPGPYRVYVYSFEPDEPPQVHVDRDLSSAKVWLSPVRLASSHGFRPVELRRILKLVEENRNGWLEAWFDRP